MQILLVIIDWKRFYLYTQRWWFVLQYWNKNRCKCTFPGGEKTWREYLTLPNILKEYNPKIKGYSVGTGEYFYKDSHLNIGFPVASILDAHMQAKVKLFEYLIVHYELDNVISKKLLFWMH